MQRRVLIGVAGTAVLGALALVDLGGLVPKPSKPLFFYLTPLVRVEVREQCWTTIGEQRARLRTSPALPSLMFPHRRSLLSSMRSLGKGAGQVTAIAMAAPAND